MKRSLLLMFVSAIVFVSCKKDDDSCSSAAPTTVASAAETAYLQNYLTANAVTASTLHGMFYNITASGSGTSPNLCSTVGVTYTGTYITGTTDGAQFDASATPVSFALNQLIAAWQLVLPLVKTGGSVTLYVPPSLGYGASGYASIPGNSYLKFTITLVSVD